MYALFRFSLVPFSSNRFSQSILTLQKVYTAIIVDGESKLFAASKRGVAIG